MCVCVCALRIVEQSEAAQSVKTSKRDALRDTLGSSVLLVTWDSGLQDRPVLSYRTQSYITMTDAVNSRYDCSLGILTKKVRARARSVSRRENIWARA